MIHDKTTKGAICTRYRPDILYLDINSKVHIQVEIDEHQHQQNNGSYQCEEKRISVIYDEFKDNVPDHYVVVRFNPDSQYSNQKIDRDQVFSSRLNALVNVINKVINNPPPYPITVIYMYYDQNNDHIVKHFPKLFVDDENELSY